MAKTADDYRKDVARLRKQLRAAEKKELEEAGQWLVDHFADASVDGTTAKIEAAKAKVLGQQTTGLMDDADAEEVDHGEATETRRCRPEDRPLDLAEGQAEREARRFCVTSGVGPRPRPSENLTEEAQILGEASPAGRTASAGSLLR